MTSRTKPILHRDDPNKEPLVGHVKVTREDWLNAARDVLVTEGVAHVKILPLGTRLGVSRSSFYWYFKNRSDLLTALLDEWENRNTARIVAQCEAPSANITEALCNFFRCFVDTAQFDRGLDFAVREWSRRDPALRGRVDGADALRLDAITAMYLRHGYALAQADTRARILYYMQLGYHALEVQEDMDLRMSRVQSYIEGFTGQEPDARAIKEFERFALSVEAHS
ncbi:TetR/AcrR family transcriptional regulator [Rhodobacteraceae bacterium]|nr:TetR/AcrR family transcriptional regulator [Paracoccaceae bacterium]